MYTAIITDSFDGNSLHKVTQIGRAFIYTNATTRDAINAIATKCYKVADYADKRSPAARKAIIAALAAIGYVTETRYNAAHGRNYDLCAYPARNESARRVTLAAQSGMSNTNPEIARPIF